MSAVVTLYGSLKRRAKREAFHPTLAGIWLNPYYLARSSLRARIAQVGPRLKGDVLDVGCGEKPYIEYFSAASSYTGLEIDSPRSRSSSKADAFYDGSRFPFGDSSFDVVFTSQTFEHVFAPGLFLAEVNRVLRPGGWFLIAVPFVWPEHETPHDFGRYTTFGLDALLGDSGFEPVAAARTRTGVATLAQLTNALLMDACPDSIALRQTVSLTIGSLVTLVGLLGGGLGTANRALFLDQVVLSRKKQ